MSANLTNMPINATGRRKSSTARVFYFNKQTANGRQITVNGRSLADYFGNMQHYLSSAMRPLDLMLIKDCKIKITVSGGGTTGQAEAISHGLARVLVAHNPEYRDQLKSAGLLRRDSRSVASKLAGRYKSRASYPFVAR